MEGGEECVKLKNHIEDCIDYGKAFLELWREDADFRAQCHIAHLKLLLSVVVLVRWLRCIA